MKNIIHHLESIDLYGININYLFKKRNFLTTLASTLFLIFVILALIIFLIYLFAEYSSSSIPNYIKKQVFYRNNDYSWNLLSDSLGYYEVSLNYPVDDFKNNKTFFQFYFGFKNNENLSFEPINLNYFNIKLSVVNNTKEIYLFFDLCKRIKGISEDEFVNAEYGKFYCVYSDLELTYSQRAQAIKSFKLELNKCVNNTFSYIPLQVFSLFDSKMDSYLKEKDLFDKNTYCNSSLGCEDIFTMYNKYNGEDLSEFEYIGREALIDFVNPNSIDAISFWKDNNTLDSQSLKFDDYMYGLENDKAYLFAKIARKFFKTTFNQNKAFKDLLNIYAELYLNQTNKYSKGLEDFETNIKKLNEENQKGFFGNQYYTPSSNYLNSMFYIIPDANNYFLKHFPIKCASENEIARKLENLELVFMFNDNKFQVFENKLNIISENDYYNFFPEVTGKSNNYELYFQVDKLKKMSFFDTFSKRADDALYDNYDYYVPTISAEDFPTRSYETNNYRVLTINIKLKDSFISYEYNYSDKIYILGIVGGISVLVYVFTNSLINFLNRFVFYIKLGNQLQMKFNYEYTIPTFKEYIEFRNQYYDEIKRKNEGGGFELKRKNVQNFNLIDNINDKKSQKRLVKMFLILNEFFDEAKVKYCIKTFNLLNDYEKHKQLKNELKNMVSEKDSFDINTNTNMTLNKSELIDKVHFKEKDNHNDSKNNNFIVEEPEEVDQNYFTPGINRVSMKDEEISHIENFNKAKLNSNKSMNRNIVYNLKTMKKENLLQEIDNPIIDDKSKSKNEEEVNEDLPEVENSQALNSNKKVHITNEMINQDSSKDTHDPAHSRRKSSNILRKSVHVKQSNFNVFSDKNVFNEMKGHRIGTKISLGFILKKIILKRKIFKTQMYEFVYDVFSKREINYTYSFLDLMALIFLPQEILCCKKYKQAHKLKKHIKLEMSIEKLVDSIRSINSIKKTVLQSENTLVFDNLPKPHLSGSDCAHLFKDNARKSVISSKFLANIKNRKNSLKVERSDELKESLKYHNITEKQYIKHQKIIEKKIGTIKTFYSVLYILLKRANLGILDKHEYYELMDANYLNSFLALEGGKHINDLRSKVQFNKLKSKQEFMDLMKRLLKSKKRKHEEALINSNHNHHKNQINNNIINLDNLDNNTKRSQNYLNDTWYDKFVNDFEFWRLEETKKNEN